MAGTVVTTEITHTSMKKIKFAWTSSAGGAADATTTEYYDGKIFAFVTDPSATAPTDNYDIVITDGDGIDVLLGAGANRDTANTEYVSQATLGGVAASKLTLAVTNAGNAKLGDAYLYIR